MLTPEERAKKLKLATFSDGVLEILTAPGEVGADDITESARNRRHLARNGPIPPEERKGLQGVEEDVAKHLMKTTTAALMSNETLGFEVLGEGDAEAGISRTDGFHISSHFPGGGLGPLKWIPPPARAMPSSQARRKETLKAETTKPVEEAANTKEVKQFTPSRPHGIQKTRCGHYQVIFKVRRGNGVRGTVHLGNYATLGEAGRRLNEYLRVENPKLDKPLNWEIFPDEYYDSPEAAAFYL